MYTSIDIPLYLFDRLRFDKASIKLYGQLLNEYNLTLIKNNSLIASITLLTYEKDCRYYGYKSKSGFWKALNKLKTMGLIEIVNKEIYFPHLKINCG